MKSRYYDPAVGRFINADKFAATGQGILGSNMFAYCNNGPVIHSDPLGAKMVVEICEGGRRYYTDMDDAAFDAGVEAAAYTSKTNLECGFVIYQDERGYFLGQRISGEHDHVTFDELPNPQIVAVVHSHPYCTRHVANKFSIIIDENGHFKGDAGVASDHNISVYLAAPNGTRYILYFDDADAENPIVREVRSGLPSDNTIFDCVLFN